MPPSKIQTGIFSDTLRRRLEGNVPSAEPFQYIPGLQGLSLGSERKLEFTPLFSGRTADTGASRNVASFNRRLLQIRVPAEGYQHFISKSTSFNQPGPGFHLGPVRRKHFLAVVVLHHPSIRAGIQVFLRLTKESICYCVTSKWALKSLFLSA